MRVLFLSQVLPYPLDAGPKVRAYFTLRHLAQRHAVSLLTFVRPGDPPSAIEHLRGICETVETITMRRGRPRDAWHLARSLVGNTPFLIQRDHSAEMIRAIRARFGPGDPAVASSGRSPGAAGFDVVHADQLWMAPYGLLALRAAGADRRPAVVLDQHNAVFQVPRRLAEHTANPAKAALLRLEACKLARYEVRVCRGFDRVVWVTEEDRRALRAAAGGGARLDEAAASTVIPICTDPAAQPVVRRRHDARRVTFLGGLHWPPNAEGIVWFAREVWPLVLRQVPDALLTVIGKSPPRALGAIGLPPSSLDVPGYVPDLLPYLAETAVFVVPLQAGGGMRVKILDAWCWGLPIVATRIGAEGIDARDGEDLLLADTAADFARAVVRLLRDPDARSRLAAGGRRAVESRYDWRQVYSRWDAIYSPVAG